MVCYYGDCDDCGRTGKYTYGRPVLCDTCRVLRIAKIERQRTKAIAKAERRLAKAAKKWERSKRAEMAGRLSLCGPDADGQLALADGGIVGSLTITVARVGGGA